MRREKQNEKSKERGTKRSVRNEGKLKEIRMKDCWITGERANGWMREER